MCVPRLRRRAPRQSTFHSRDAEVAAAARSDRVGGWGGRANLVPQDANFNRGNWAQLENKMAACGSLPSGRLRYYIGANDPNSTKLSPHNLTMEIRNQSMGSSVTLSFSNVDYGGSSGTTERTRGTTWLTNQGCG